MRKKGGKKFSGDAGIAIGPILFIIAILGILAAAISAGNRFFNADTSTENARAAAQAIVDYGEQIQNGVDTMLGRGIDPLNLSFSHTVYLQNGTLSSNTYNQNPNCTNDTCELFKPSGGGVAPHDFHIYGHTPLTIWQPSWQQTGSVDFIIASVGGIGTSNSELLLRIVGLRLDVVAQINSIVGYTAGGNSISGTPYLWANSGGTSVPNNVWTLGQTYTGAVNGHRRFCVSNSEYGDYSVVLLVN